MNRKQRIHSAELRRLDHIARSLDRIGNALIRLHETIVSGNGNRIIEVGRDIIAKDNASIQQATIKVGSGVGISTGLSKFENPSISTFNGSVKADDVAMRNITNLTHKPGTG